MISMTPGRKDQQEGHDGPVLLTRVLVLSSAFKGSCFYIAKLNKTTRVPYGFQFPKLLWKRAIVKLF